MRQAGDRPRGRVRGDGRVMQLSGRGGQPADVHRVAVAQGARTQLVGNLDEGRQRVAAEQVGLGRGTAYGLEGRRPSTAAATRPTMLGPW